MVATFDFTGLAAVIAAFTGLVAAVGVILNGRTAAAVKADTAHIATAVTTSNGTTLAELADQGEARRVDALPVDPPPPPH